MIHDNHYQSFNSYVINMCTMIEIITNKAKTKKAKYRGQVFLGVLCQFCFFQFVLSRVFRFLVVLHLSALRNTRT